LVGLDNYDKPVRFATVNYSCDDDEMMTADVTCRGHNDTIIVARY